jgi:hypothetical protein
MLKAAFCSGLALAMTSLCVQAETIGGATIGAWNVNLEQLPPYEYFRDDGPLTGAARFAAPRPGETVGSREADFRTPSTFQKRFQRSYFKNTDNPDQDFGPGPELVVPTLSPLFELKRR